MLRVDFAFLADYARADNAAITAVGAGRRTLELPEFLRNATYDVFIAGRVLSTPDQDPVLVFGIQSPNREVNMTIEVPLGSGPSLPQSDEVPALFAFRAPLPMVEEGDWTFTIAHAGEVLSSMTLSISFTEEGLYTEVRPN
ncbi:hypothetical protein ACPPVW_06415 [Leifsonia sp. McL0607]|uniref:hypothetical protein n=1 Tax=Leifsonia sp. McL0607 TaxID=3415672 RepID=UPI003CFA3733